MRNVLFGLGVVSLVLCLLAFGVSMTTNSAIHETEAALLFVAFAVLLSGAAVVDALAANRTALAPRDFWPVVNAVEGVKTQVSELRQDLAEQKQAPAAVRVVSED